MRSKDPTTAIRVVLRGARSVATPAEPTAPAMPSFGWQLKDDQIAAVLTFIRNSWGTGWGDHGFAYASQAYIQAGFYNESYGVTV